MGNTEKTIATAYKVTLTDNALFNIGEITGCIVFINHQPLNAIIVGEAIFETIDRIKANPFAFKECEEIPTKAKMYRKAVCYSWYVIYKVVDTSIRIIGVIHASRKPSKIKNLRKVK